MDIKLPAHTFQVIGSKTNVVTIGSAASSSSSVLKSQILAVNGLKSTQSCEPPSKTSSSQPKEGPNLCPAVVYYHDTNSRESDFQRELLLCEKELLIISAGERTKEIDCWQTILSSLGTNSS